MTRHLPILALLLLAACFAPRHLGGGYRDTARPISSMAVLETARLDGNWHEVAGFGAGCGAASVLTVSNSAATLSGNACFLPVRGRLALTPGGPGRFRAGTAEFWLLWVDFDYRTMVVGTPSGDFGAILNRGGPIPEDRLEAARRLLAFNGYDPARLTLASGR